MGRVIVKGHGNDADGGRTFLPSGVKITMYTAERVNLATETALMVLLDAAGAPGTTIENSILNYTLIAQDEPFRATWEKLGGHSGTPITWIGSGPRDIPDGTRLCADPGWDPRDPTRGTCAENGVHTCTGVLGRLRGETDIALVACRGSEVAGDIEYRDALSAPGHVPTYYDEMWTDWDQIIKKMGGAFTAVAVYGNAVTAQQRDEFEAAENQIDSMNPATRALLETRPYFDAWETARTLRDHARRNDLNAVFTLLVDRSGEAAELLGTLYKVPWYGAELDRIATDYPETFGLWVKQLLRGGAAGDDVLRAMLKRPALDRVITESVDSGGMARLAGVEGATVARAANAAPVPVEQMDEWQAAGALADAADGRRFDELVRILNAVEPRMDRIMAALDRYPERGAALDNLAAGAPDALFRALKLGVGDRVREALMRRPHLARAEESAMSRMMRDPEHAGDAEFFSNYLAGKLRAGEVELVEAEIAALPAWTRGLLEDRAWYQGWVHATAVRELAEDADVDALLARLAGLDPAILDATMACLRDTHRYGHPLDTLVTKFPQAIAGRLRQATEAVRVALLTRPVIAQAVGPLLAD